MAAGKCYVQRQLDSAASKQSIFKESVLSRDIVEAGTVTELT